MFTDYLLDISSADYANKILLIDIDDLDNYVHYDTAFASRGFDVVYYKDDLSFRLEYADELKNTDSKLVVIAQSGDFIPYDLRQKLQTYMLSMDQLFPKLNHATLTNHDNLDLDLLSNAYQKNFDDCRLPEQTERFLKDKVYSSENVEDYLKLMYSNLMTEISETMDYHVWMATAETKAHIDLMAIKYHIQIDTSEINKKFRDYVLKQYGKLSTEYDKETPVMVSHAMEYMHAESEKFIIVVMDGMSEFDWEIISSSFKDIPFERTASFAMIPSTTSISRQCLLSNKYPSQLMEPWKQSKEKQEFLSCAKEMGYSENQIGYGRGYNTEFSPLVRCGAVIINDVDEMVHAQHQGRTGMLNDIELMTRQGKLAEMTRRFIETGFDVYITADHGNTPCVGLGRLKNTGVEVETKSHRMVVLQNFADKELLQGKYRMIDYPKYYLDKKYDYLICDVGDSLDIKGEDVITHGGISIDEVIVPFIKIKAVNENG